MPAWYYLIIAFIVLDFITVLFVLRSKYKRKDSFTVEQFEYMDSHWRRIVRDLEYDSKNAVMDADKLLDYALAIKGFRGNLGDKLKSAQSLFSDLNGVWDAHKLRNKIAHEMMDLPVSDAKLALSQFKRALNDLGASL